MINIKLSVVIPTKNRYECLIPSLEAMLKTISDNSIEFIIQDNSEDNKEFLNFLSNNSDNRIRYYHSLKNMPMFENFEEGFSNVRGEFFIMIGDDDFIHPNTINFLHSFNTNGIDCMMYDRPVYYWPNVSFPNEASFFKAATLMYPTNTSYKYQILESCNSLKAFEEKGSFYLHNLPGAYHGIVRTSIAHEIKKKLGNFASEASPDLSMSMALIFTIKSYIWLDTPLSIPGASYNSAAGMGRRGTHSTILEEIPDSMPSDLSTNWEIGLPRIWNGFTLYIDTATKVARKFDYILDFNREKLLNKLISDNISDTKYVTSSSFFKDLNILIKLRIILSGSISYFMRVIFWKVPGSIKTIILKQRMPYKTLSSHSNIKSPMECLNILKKNEL